MTKPVLTLARPDPQFVRATAVVFEDSKSRALLRGIERLAPSDTTVLLHGEVGTGKEIVAQHLHELGPRAGGPFVTVDCGALAGALIERELFGHERGAFPGAHADKAGWFERAQAGTLYLDRIAELAPSAQARLLRVLQHRESIRIGARGGIAVDVRVIAATEVALDRAVAAGRFRKDLAGQLGAASLSLHPLRERADDIVPLAIHFLDVHRKRLGIEAATLSSDAIAGLLGHAWPGNIQELERVVARALLACRSQRITRRDLQLAPVSPRRGRRLDRLAASRGR